MKYLLVLALGLLVVVTAQEAVVPDSNVGIFDNPNTDTNPVQTIPSAPDCTVRPQTIVEVKRMRKAAAHIAQLIQLEVAIMEKRKTYVEQMTAYLNDRIRELNKVKGELAQENRWIEVSNQRIAELAEKEKLIKMQDILSCLSSNKNRLAGERDSQSKQMAAMQAQANVIAQKINSIKGTISAVNGGADPNTPTPAAGAAGAAAPALQQG
eukprot:CAMPEP_0183352430 /NCGR_PEP_ID=MMETSP0164_2-20130417/29433_1 /TAXON_ID=221442 /ORGANISM="Coccolithus pelagicus ssp braarudi, Strain PLY182g" /LENGTH=209 /DNA_ID=CAMNT_0025524855 /DNA_START=53 /DNA_END=682 /DNA_ORIENTATION=+